MDAMKFQTIKNRFEALKKEYENLLFILGDEGYILPVNKYIGKAYTCTLELRIKQ